MSEPREYRGKRIDNCEFAFGYVIKGNTGRTFIISYADCSNGELERVLWIEVDPTTIGQYTGLTDKNGVKIFENDLMRWDEKEWGGIYTEIVEWNYDLLAYRVNDWHEFCEVIGSIHDNPELRDGTHELFKGIEEEAE